MLAAVPCRRCNDVELRDMISAPSWISYTLASASQPNCRLNLQKRAQTPARGCDDEAAKRLATLFMISIQSVGELDLVLRCMESERVAQ